MNKFATILLLTSAALIAANCAEKTSEPFIHGPFIFKASEKNPGTLEMIGKLKMEDLGEKGTKIRIKVKDLEPGFHAMHLHETGRCEGPDFKSAGGHFNPTSSAHGNVADGPHAGDMMNIEIGADGTGEFEIINPHVSLTSNHFPSLNDEDGTSLIIHAKADDYTSQPSGAAGPRVACALIPRPK